MPRTAPAPNMVATPGMNPGNIVAGGGGNAGGGSGKSGKGGRGGKGGDGGNGGDDAEGGGKSAGACGAGDGGCPNPQHGSGGNVSAGDPVDVASGRVFSVPVVDLALGGPLPLIVRRSYSTASVARDVGLGRGWSHSFAWEIEVRRRGFVLWTATGDRRKDRVPALGGVVRLDVGELVRLEHGYALVSKDGLTRTFAPWGEGGRHLLVSVADRHANTITLQYDNGALSSFVDTVGRVVRVERGPTGHIAAFAAPIDESGTRYHRLRTYRFDDASHLIAAVNADGAETTFAYEQGFVVHKRRPDGLEVHYRYDRQRRCVETWIDFGGRPDPSLDAEVPEFLADGQTRARGAHHCKLDFLDDGFVEVTDSRQVRRVFVNEHGKADRLDWGGAVSSNTFDERGNLIGHTNAEEHHTSWLYDEHDRLLEARDARGQKLEFSYHPSGGVEAIRGPGDDFVRYHRDATGHALYVEDQAGPVVQYEYDARGRVTRAIATNGAQTRFEYDAHGNRSRIVEPDGAERVIGYDFWGRAVLHRDARGLETNFTYDACGRVVRTHTNAGLDLRTDYDVQGRVSRSFDAAYRATTFHYGGLDRVVGVERADGTRVEYRYDREGALVRIRNEAGEEHSLIRASSGYIRGEETFDGRSVAYGYDGTGQLTELECGSKNVVATFGPTGLLTSREYADGSLDEYEHDASERLVRAKNADVEVEYTYDARGNATREVVRVRGREYAFEHEYDGAYQRVRSHLDGERLSQARYDLAGRLLRLDLPHGDFVESRFDAGGLEMARKFAGGGGVARRFDAAGRQQSLHVFDSARLAETAAGPEWVGGGRGESWSRSFAYDAAGDVVRTSEPDGSLENEYDVLGRLVHTTHSDGDEQRYRYDVAGNWYPDVGRQYDEGGRLARYGDSSLRYDAQGNVIEKIVRLSEGGEARTTFEWAASGHLRAVIEPDETRHEFVQDLFGRCLVQESFREGERIASTIFVWDGERLTRERTEIPRENGVAVSERHYVYVPSTVAVVAERRLDWFEFDGARSEETDSGWLYHESADDGSPSLLLSADGRVVERADITPWGRLGPRHRSTTRLRRQGQYVAPAGLHYNRHRFYDPEAGIFLSPEPLGVGESLRPYAYVDNYPHRVVDIDGLAKKEPMTTVIKRKGGLEDVSETSGQKRDKSGKKLPIVLHPAVEAALPPSNARGDHSFTPPNSCGEPQALSKHLRDWETRNPPKSCEPGAENWQDNLKEALDEIDEISSSKEGKDFAACENCSQTIPRLAKMAGTKTPKIKAPAGGSATTSPHPDYTKDAETIAKNRKANVEKLSPDQKKAVEDMDLGIY